MLIIKREFTNVDSLLFWSYSCRANILSFQKVLGAVDKEAT